MSPSLYGIKYLCCPTQAQRELRNDIMARRRVREKLYPENFKEIEVFNDLEDQYAQREAQEKLKAEQAKAKKEKGREGSYKVWRWWECHCSGRDIAHSSDCFG